MRWLANRLGIDRLLKAEVITPDSPLFTATLQPNEAEAGALLKLLAGRMGIAAVPAVVSLNAAELGGHAGRYVPGPPPRFELNLEQLSAMESAMLLLVRLLAQHILAGRDMLDPDEVDAPQLAELLLIYLGVGIIAVNHSILEETYRAGDMTWWRMQRTTTLTPMDFGYALALFAHVRGEHEPAWAAQLRPDAQDVMKKGLRFLEKTGDTVFRLDLLRERLHPPSRADAHDRLAVDAGPTVQLLTLWQLEKTPLRETGIAEIITTKLQHREWAIVAAAAAALEALGAMAASAAPELLRALEHSHPRVRAAAARALGAVPSDEEQAVRVLTYLLQDSNGYVVACAGYALGMFGPKALESAAPLLQAIDAGLYQDSSGFHTTQLLASLLRIDPEAEGRIRTFYEEGNDEHLSHLLSLLGEMHLEPTSGESGAN
jgi:hypothetical protein